MPIKDISNNVAYYGVGSPREGEKLPQFPFKPPEWPKDSPFPKLKKEIEMNDVKKFIKLLRKNLKEKSGYIDKQNMDTIILDTLEEMNDNE